PEGGSRKRAICHNAASAGKARWRLSGLTSEFRVQRHWCAAEIQAMTGIQIVRPPLPVRVSKVSLWRSKHGASMGVLPLFGNQWFQIASYVSRICVTWPSCAKTAYVADGSASLMQLFGTGPHFVTPAAHTCSMPSSLEPVVMPTGGSSFL